MIISTRDLPPLNTLLVFEAVARHLSFTAAGRELGVSQAATSQKVKQLEESLGVTLFKRSRPTIGLTDEGQVLAAAVANGIAAIQEAVRAIRPRDRGHRLTVATMVSFSSFWLMPRLPAFHAVAPEAELRLLATDAEIDWHGEAVDLAVVFGRGPWKGFEAQSLFGDEILAVARRDLAERFGQEPSLEHLADATLLQLETRNPEWVTWDGWFAHNGLPLAHPPKGPRFNNYIHLVQAALEGQGIALGWRRLVEPHLLRGELVPVSQRRMVPTPTFHVVVPEFNARRPLVRAFRRWLRAEADADW